jgi:hypothetical protein
MVVCGSSPSLRPRHHATRIGFARRLPLKRAIAHCRPAPTQRARASATDCGLAKTSLANAAT